MHPKYSIVQFIRTAFLLLILIVFSASVNAAADSELDDAKFAIRSKPQIFISSWHVRVILKRSTSSQCCLNREKE